MLKCAQVFGWLPNEDPHPASAVNVMGLTFPNRLGLAAGMDKSASAVDAWMALGFGCIEVGTLTPRLQSGNPTPRLFRLPEHWAVINRMGFNNPGIDSAVSRLRRRHSAGIIGVNIGKNFDTPNERAADDYLYCLRAAYEVADYIAINISSPNTKGLRDLQAEEPVRKLLGALKQEQTKLSDLHGKHVPLAVKIAPDLDSSQIESLARVFSELGIDGVIATNTTLSRTHVEKHPLANESGGLSGSPLRARSLEVLQAFRSLLSPTIPLIGVGGIMNAIHAVEKLNAGASLVQIYTGLVYRGPALVHELSQIGAPHAYPDLVDAGYY
jgi:dihydroorotate dehydrogenase